MNENDTSNVPGVLPDVVDDHAREFSAVVPIESQRMNDSRHDESDYEATARDSYASLQSMVSQQSHQQSLALAERETQITDKELNAYAEESQASGSRNVMIVVVGFMYLCCEELFECAKI